MDAITIRELYEESDGCTVTGTIEQVNGQNLEELKSQMSSKTQLGNMKVKSVKYGEPEPHSKGVFFIVLGIILSIVGLVLIIFCFCKLWKKCRNKIFKKEITYEMYGEFRD